MGDFRLKSVHRACKLDQDNMQFPTVTCKPEDIIDLVKADLRKPTETNLKTGTDENRPMPKEDCRSYKDTTQKSLALAAINNKRVHFTTETKIFVVEGSKGDPYAVALHPKEQCQCPSMGTCYPYSGSKSIIISIFGTSALAEHTVTLDSDDSSGEETVPLQKTKSRCRRGLAARLAAKREDPHPSDSIPEKASVYSTRVANVLNSCHIPTEVNEGEIISDEEDGSPLTENEKSKSQCKTSANRKRGSSQSTSSDIDEISIVEDEVYMIDCTLPKAVSSHSAETMKSPSPPPPPAPNDVITVKSKRPRMTRALKSAMKNISAAKSYLQVSDYKDNRRQLMDNVDSDVICLDDSLDENSVLFFIRFGVTTKKYTMNKLEPFNTIFKDIAQREKIEEKFILLIYNDRSICPSDSPQSLNLKPADIIEFHKSSGKRLDTSFSGESLYGNQIQLFVQSRDSKQRMEFSISKNAPLTALINKFSAKTNKDPAKFRLQFDGEDILHNDTADSLELEDGYCLDVIFV